MKRNTLKWAMPIAAICLLATACSKENNKPDELKTRSLTIGCGIGETAPKADTRATVKPGNTDESKESFIWHEGDRFDGWLIPEGESDYAATSAMFDIDKSYSNSAPSNSASFTCPGFPVASPSYKMLALYPDFVLESNNEFKNEFLYVVSAEPQIGRNSTDHLKKNMHMYAMAKVTSSSDVPAMTFRHLAAMMRFTVANKNASACRVQYIEIYNFNPDPVFGMKFYMKVDNWESGAITNRCDQSSSAVTLITRNSPTDSRGIELAAAGDVDKRDTFDAYMMVGPSDTPLTGQKLIFKIGVADADGNERTYISLALDANKILAQNGDATTWEAGKRYWFDLLLDDELTVELKEVTNLPGWDDETDL